MKKVTTSATLSYLCTPGLRQVCNVWSSCLRLGLCSLLLLGALLASTSAQARITHKQAKIKAGDILVVDQWRNAVFLVNPKTGQRTVFSDFGQPAAGPGALASVALGPEGQIFVSELFSDAFPAGALYGIDPNTGDPSILRDFGQGDIQAHPYYGLAVDRKGRVIVNADRYEPPLFELDATLVRVDPKTDEAVFVSDLKNPAQGPTVSGFFSIEDLTLEKTGKILISTVAVAADFTQNSAIFRVNPETGKRRLLSDSADPAQGVDEFNVSFAEGLAVEVSGQILVNSFGNRNLLLRIDPRTGNRTVLSDFDNPAQGDLGGALYGIGVETSGGIIVGANSPGPNVLFRVNPTTGLRTVLSDSNNPSQGPSISVAAYIAIVSSDSDAEGHH